MTLRNKLLGWYSLMLISGLLLIVLALYYEIAIEGHMVADGFWDVVGEIFFWSGIPASLLIFGGLAWLWTMRRSLAPLDRLTRVAAEINSGTLHRTIERTGNGDELDQLAAAFNAMVGRLDEAFQRVREFTMHASHELKTPLSILRNEVETALQEPSLNPTQRERFCAQLEEIGRLTQIVDGLTLLASADSGLLRLQQESVDLAEVIREIAEDTTTLAGERNIAVQLERCDACRVRGDRNRLRQLFLNLADNAVKYADAGGRIDLRLTTAADRAEFVITNTGQGLAPELQGRVFERFFRGDASHGRSAEGCGLGLAIVRSITEAHRGSVSFSSQPGRTTTVRVVLPLDTGRDSRRPVDTAPTGRSLEDVAMAESRGQASA